MTWEEMRRAIQSHCEARGDISGMPLPIERHALMTAPIAKLRHLNGKRLDEPAPAELKLKEGLPPGYTITNRWWSARRRTWIAAVRNPQGRAEVAYQPYAIELEPLYRWKMLMDTFEAGISAWEFDAEVKAIELLGTLITPAQAKLYWMTGCFVEGSKRSTAAYIFRRLRPTIAMLRGERGDYYPSAALCLHPLAYYAETWAGGMVPTDEVIAHLMLMRGDEALFWRRANQHPIDRTEAGI
jgi:hypothetical protein